MPSDLPPGAWAVGVSGGADSVALLHLLHSRGTALHVVHLNHQTRGRESDADEQLVTAHARALGLALTVARRSDLEAGGSVEPANASARFRRLRRLLFTRVVEQQGLAGVALAHHADDQAETVMQRIIRGSGPALLGAMASLSTQGRLTVAHPLLHCRRSALRDYLIARGIAWRDDASNDSPAYQRNRVRRLLSAHPHLTPMLLQIADAARRYAQGVDAAASGATPGSGVTLRAGDLARLPAPVARQVVYQWLVMRGGSKSDLSRRVLDEVLAMAVDAATPPRRHVAGGLLVRRRRGVLEVASA